MNLSSINTKSIREHKKLFSIRAMQIMFHFLKMYKDEVNKPIKDIKSQKSTSCDGIEEVKFLLVPRYLLELIIVNIYPFHDLCFFDVLNY